MCSSFSVFCKGSPPFCSTRLSILFSLSQASLPYFNERRRSRSNYCMRENSRWFFSSPRRCVTVNCKQDSIVRHIRRQNQSKMIFSENVSFFLFSHYSFFDLRIYNFACQSQFFFFLGEGMLAFKSGNVIEYGTF